MRSNPILFVLILVRVLLNQNFIGNDEGGSCRAVVSGRRYNEALSTTQAETQRAKATHLTSVFCTLKPQEVEMKIQAYVWGARIRDDRI